MPLNKPISAKPKSSRQRHKRLTEPAVASIKRMLLEGVKGVSIAEIFKVSQETISLIKTGKIWKNVEPAPEPSPELPPIDLEPFPLTSILEPLSEADLEEVKKAIRSLL